MLMLAGCGYTAGATGVPTPAPAATPTSTAVASVAPQPMAYPLSAAVPAETTLALGNKLPLATRQALFDEVWRTVNDNYLYPDFHGVDWQAVRQEFAPQIEAAGTNEEFYGLLTAMVQRLGDDHSRFLAPSAARQEDVLTSGKEEQVGIGVLLVASSEDAWVQAVFPNSPAAAVGMRPRDRIIAVDGHPFTSQDEIHGPAGSQVRLTVVRPGGKPRDLLLTRRPVSGRIEPQASRLDGDIGYLSIPTLWVNDMADQVSGALTTMVAERPLRGLILDLRGNPGGWQPVLYSVLSHFVQGETGVFFSRQQTRPVMVSNGPGPDLQGLPLVVLVDSGTASYAEVLAAILQQEANATVVGMPSAGNTETIYVYELATGARLWVAQEGFRLPNGASLEGTGVAPDLLLTLDWTRYSEADDPHINAALKLLHEQGR